MPFHALLCDLDGTLADSEPLHCSAWLTTLSEDFGLDHYDEHWFEQWVGTSDVALGASVIEENKLAVTVDELAEAKRRRFHELVRTRATAFPGVAEMLGKIKEKYPLAIATNSGRADADLMITCLGLDEFTEVSVTASDVTERKPAPDIYLLAAARLGVPATECIAIEDSGPGGEAAKAAGCYLIGLTPAVTMADELASDNKAALVRALELLQ